MLPPEAAGPLLSTVPGVYHAHVNDVLLAGLALALGRWRPGVRVVVDLEGHGRDETLLPGADLSRTVGCFTSVHPVPLGAQDPAATPAEAVRRVKELLRAAPDSGVGYGTAAPRQPGHRRTPRPAGPRAGRLQLPGPHGRVRRARRRLVTRP